jgi:pilus assembly protein Flp/PilA
MLYLPEERGQGLVEYALLLVLVALIVFAMVVVFGGSIGNLYSNIINNF